MTEQEKLDLVADGCFTLDEIPDQLPTGCGFGRATLYKHMASGEVLYIRVGKRRLIPKKALLQFLARRVVVGAPQPNKSTPNVP